MSGLFVEKVIPGSIAEELEIEPGDLLKAVNGNPLRDVIDYNYFSSEQDLTLEIVKPSGEIWELNIERDEGEPLGLIFPPPEPIRCGNRCIFCFVHQLPRGLRSPLYVKDEDYRLSFLYGNYVTLANIGREDIDRIKEQRLSPLYISVHSTETALRETLLGKHGVIPIMEILEELADARITMHTQVVLCPGVNDGKALKRTVRDLAALYPWVRSVAVVPVGLTRHRQGLARLQQVTGKYAASFIERWGPEASGIAEKIGEPFLFFADEFYLKARKPFPALDTYGDLPQLENGVGMAPLFLAEAREVLKQAAPLRPFRATVVTGKSPYRLLSWFLRSLSKKTGVELQPIAVKNRLFGRSVTVAGLLTGRDIIESLSGREFGEVLIIPDVMLKEEENLFLDDMTPHDLEKALGARIAVVEATPAGIYEFLKEAASPR